MSIDLTPPSGASYEARRALKMLESHNSTGISMALAVARDIEAGSELPESTVRRMKDFFTTHAEESRSADFFSDEKPSSSRVRWGLYGGDCGHAWAEKVVRTLDASDASEGRAIAAEKARVTEGDAVERRFCGSFDSAETASDEALAVEERADSTGGKKTYIVGYAAKFGFDSVLLGDFVERIAPTAFDILKTGKDGDGKKIATRGLFNHNPDFLLGRYPDTMSLEVDEKGLRYEILLPDSQRAIAEAISRGDLRGSSFSFVIAPGGEKWSYENGQSIRTVSKIKTIVDCGPVTFPAYDSSSCAIAMRSFDQFTVQRRAEDCGREADGKFGSGNKCAGASDIEGSRLVEGALNGSVLGGAIGGAAAGGYGFGIGAATGAVVGAVAHGLLYESSHQEASLKDAYEKTGTSTEKFDKAAKTLGVTLHITSYPTEKNGPAVVATASRGDFKLTVEGTSAKPAGPLSMSVRGVRSDSGVSPAKAASLLARAAKQLGASTIIVDAHDDPAMRKGLVANGFTDRDGILTRRIGSLKATKRSIEAFLAERRGDCGRDSDGKFGSGNSCAGGDSGKSAEKQMKDDNFHATYGVKLKQEFDKDKAISEKAKAKLRGAVESQNKPHEASTSTWELPDAETPAEKEASGKPPVVIYKAQLAAKSAARLAASAPKKSMTWEKGDNKSPEKTAAAQKFIEDAHDDHMKLGGKSGGKSDDGGGVQTWSKGDHFPWTMKQVGSDSGHVQAQHPDGSVTSKHPFEGGNVGPAISKLKAELLAAKSKKSQRHEMLIAFLEKRTK